jgi:putative Mg2+ transporter-C (MgtC) family protein
LTVRGLATAATLWCSAAVGVLAGAGRVFEAAVGTACVLFVHLALRPLVYWIELRTKMTVEIETSYRMSVVCPGEQTAVVRGICMRHVNSEACMTVHGIHIEDAGDGIRKAIVVDVASSRRNDKFMNELVNRIGIEPNVSAISWQRVNCN